MKKATILILFLALVLLVVGCTRNQGTTGYESYGQPQQQQNPSQGYYGGGCGVSPADNLEMPVENIVSAANL